MHKSLVVVIGLAMLLAMVPMARGGTANSMGSIVGMWTLPDGTIVCSSSLAMYISPEDPKHWVKVSPPVDEFVRRVAGGSKGRILFLTQTKQAMLNNQDVYRLRSVSPTGEMALINESIRFDFSPVRSQCSFADEKLGAYWGEGRKLLFTEDGGRTWKAKQTPALNLDTAVKLRWLSPLELLIGDGHGRVCLLELTPQSAKLRWKVQLQSPTVGMEPTGNGVVWVLSGGRLTALQVADGKTIVAADVGMNVESLFCDEHHVYLCGLGGVGIWDWDGTILKLSRKLPSPMTQGMAIRKEGVWLLAMDGQVYRLSDDGPVKQQIVIEGR